MYIYYNMHKYCEIFKYFRITRINKRNKRNICDSLREVRLSKL